MYRITLILTICSGILFSGCSAQKRLTRLCEKNPDLCIVSDTLRDTTYFVREFDVHDTSYITLPIDTIEITNEKVYTRIIREHDTLKVFQEIEPDTLIQINEKIVTKYVTNCRPWWHYVLLTLGVISLLLWTRNKVWTNL